MLTPPDGATPLCHQPGASEQRLDRLAPFRPYGPNFSLDPLSQHSGAVFVKAIAAELYLGGWQWQVGELRCRENVAQLRWIAAACLFQGLADDPPHREAAAEHLIGGRIRRIGLRRLVGRNEFLVSGNVDIPIPDHRRKEPVRRISQTFADGIVAFRTSG